MEASSCKGSEIHPGVNPEWLSHYLSEMKAEIKKEVTEEVLQTVLQRHINCDTKLTVLNLKDEESTKELKNDVIVHDGIFCDNCDGQICGIRYKCGNCTDFDLCQECECIPDIHERSHIFLKIRYPFPPQLRPKRRLHKLCKNETVNNAEQFFLDSLSFEQTENSNTKILNGLMEAKFIRDETVPDETVLSPGIKFMKSWRVRNSGTKSWTKDTVLRYLWGSKDLKPLSYEVEAPQIQPCEEGIVTVHFISPVVPGQYQSHWEFNHKNLAFGNRLWCNIQVQLNQPSSPEFLKNMKIFETDRASYKCIKNTGNNSKKEATHIVDVHTAVQEEHNRGSEYEDSSSIRSLSSSESDTEFVVIPMPRCFSFSEPFSSCHLLQPFIPEEVMTSAVVSHHYHKCQKTSSYLKECQDIASNSIVQQKKTQEKVSQETGAPEEAENLNMQNLIELNENGNNQMMSDVTLICSSSGVSVIDSEESNPHIVIPLTVDSVTRNGQVLETIKIEELKSLDIQSNGTLPKFPLETDSFEVSNVSQTEPKQEEKRTIQVLPDGLVSGALLAAATVYNTARAVISSMQPGKNCQEGNNTHDRTEDAAGQVFQHSFKSFDPAEQLIEMGFCNRSQNAQLLEKHNGDVAMVVGELINMNDNDWYASRHSANSSSHGKD